MGLLFAAPGAGALLGSLLSGWTGRVRGQARALVFCMLGWGAAIVVFGLVHVLWVGLVMLAIAGASDVFGTVFRVSILQRRTPDYLQGRLSGTFFAAAVAGNRLGDAESGVAAAIGGPQFAVWSGGVACLIGTLLITWRVPALRKSDETGREDPALRSAERGSLGVAAGSEQGPGPLIGELPVDHDPASVDQNVVDAVGLGVESPGPPGEIEAHGDVTAADRVGVEDDEVGVPSFGNTSAVLQPVEATRAHRSGAGSLLRREGAGDPAPPCPRARWRS